MIKFSFNDIKIINTIIIGEVIQYGQHVEILQISGLVDGEWKVITKEGSIGYKKIIEFDEIALSEIKFDFIQFREKLNINHIILLNLTK